MDQDNHYLLSLLVGPQHHPRRGLSDVKEMLPHTTPQTRSECQETMVTPSNTHSHCHPCQSDTTIHSHMYTDTTIHSHMCTDTTVYSHKVHRRNCLLTQGAQTQQSTHTCAQTQLSTHTRCTDATVYSHMVHRHSCILTQGTQTQLYTHTRCTDATVYSHKVHRRSCILTHGAQTQQSIHTHTSNSSSVLTRPRLPLGPLFPRRPRLPCCVVGRNFHLIELTAH